MTDAMVQVEEASRTENGAIEVSLRIVHLPPHLLCSPRQADVHGLAEDDDYDRRPQRRRYEEPVYVRLRKQLLGLAESVSTSEATADRGKLIVL